MFLSHLSLHNFRNYKKAEFKLTPQTNLIIGPNTAGKSNLVEAVSLLATGKSFRIEKESHMIFFGKDIARVKGEFINEYEEQVMLEVVLIQGSQIGRSAPAKKYLVNGVARRRVDFASHFQVVVFAPTDLDIIVDSPSLRRAFLDEVLEQAQKDYRIAILEYSKALRQRNALLEQVRESGGRRSDETFAYWDEVLIRNAEVITRYRQAFIDFVNQEEKKIFDCMLTYDKSICSRERLLQYKDAEGASGVTLVGPHRDDFWVDMAVGGKKSEHNVKYYGSRGQQRLVVLQLKMLEMEFIQKAKGVWPVLLLDDIFSELDTANIHHVWTMIGRSQTIITTTHEEFVPKEIQKSAAFIRLPLQ